METLTFYSYKGGVGRTLALSNTASYLSKFGLSVCVLDFDLEAPGLHYKFGIDSNSIDKGLVDYIYDFIKNDKINKISDYVIRIEKKGDGNISLIPAGSVLKPDYWQKLSEINWSNLLYDTNGKGILFFLELIEIIKKEIKPDFLLIDSRTGITEIGGICTSLLADKVIFLLTNNNESLDGSCQILKSLQRSERFPNREKVKPFFVLSRIPWSNEKEIDFEKKIVKNVSEKLGLDIKDLNTELTIIHSDRNLEISEIIAINDLFSQKQISSLLNDYLTLFSKIIPEKIILPKLKSYIEKELKNLFTDPDKTQIEFENLVKSYKHPITLQSLIDFYYLRNIFDERYLTNFEKLFQISDNISEKHLTKYIELFLKGDFNRWNKKTNFNLLFVEKSIEILRIQDFKIYIRLADAFSSIDKDEQALQILFSLIDNDKDNKEIIKKIISVIAFSNSKKDILLDFNTDILELYSKFQNTIDDDVDLLCDYAISLLKYDKLEELSSLFVEENSSLIKRLIEYYPYYLISIFEKLNKNIKLIEILTEALDTGMVKNWNLSTIGRFFKQNDKLDVFKNKISKLENSAEIIKEVERGY